MEDGKCAVCGKIPEVNLKVVVRVNGKEVEQYYCSPNCVDRSKHSRSVKDWIIGTIPFEEDV